MNTEAKQEQSKSGKRRGGEKGKRLRLKESVSIVCLAKFSRSSVSFLSWRVLGIPWVFRVCVHVVSLCVPVVTVPFSKVNVDSEVVSVIRTVYLLSRRSPLSRKREGSAGF